MVSSILTNNGAMTALQSLKATQKNLLDTQNRISTGLKVSNAKDNASTWAVATSMRSDIANFKQVSENLSVTASILTAARSGAEQVSELLTEVKAKITAAQDPSKDKAQLQADIEQLIAQVGSTVESSSYKGINLLDSGDAQRFLASVNSGKDGASTPTYINVAGQNLTEGGQLSSLKGLSVLSRGDSLFNDEDPAEVTAAQKAMGTRQLAYTFTQGSLVADDITDTEEFTVNYKDANGVAKTLSFGVKGLDNGASSAQDVANALNGNASFSALFHASYDGTNFLVSAANREQETGSFEITGLTNASMATANISQSTMTFQDGQSLKASDEFTFNYKLAGVEKTVTLRVGDEKTGTVLDLSDDGNEIVIAVKIGEVSGDNIEGADIASKFETALTGSWYEANGTTVSALTAANFGLAATATAGTSLGVDATDSTLKFSAATTGTDKLISVKPPQTDYQSLLNSVTEALDNATNSAATLGSAGQRVDMQKEFMDKLVDTLTSGVGALVDADMSEEAARLQALQVQEQLGTQALSIANQAPQSILSLFRG